MLASEEGNVGYVYRDNLGAIGGIISVRPRDHGKGGHTEEVQGTPTPQVEGQQQMPFRASVEA